jgi:hypothetical protein
VKEGLARDSIQAAKEGIRRRISTNMDSLLIQLRNPEKLIGGGRGRRTEVRGGMDDGLTHPSDTNTQL